MIVDTPAEAERINTEGTTQPYLAANWHTMIAPVRPLERPYRAGDRVAYDSWRAWCAKDCAACAEGVPLPDW